MSTMKKIKSFWDIFLFNIANARCKELVGYYHPKFICIYYKVALVYLLLFVLTLISRASLTFLLNSKVVSVV